MAAIHGHVHAVCDRVCGPWDRYDGGYLASLWHRHEWAFTMGAGVRRRMRHPDYLIPLAGIAGPRICACQTHGDADCDECPGRYHRANCVTSPVPGADGATLGSQGGVLPGSLGTRRGALAPL